MIPVSVEGVRRNFGISSVFMYTVTLVDEPGQRMLNITVERHEALAIVAALHHLTLPRLQMINLLADTLAFHGVVLDEIRLERVSLSPIYLVSATLFWRPGDNRTREQTRDMRPGDAIGLALLMECPLVLSDYLAQQTGHPQHLLRPRRKAHRGGTAGCQPGRRSDRLAAALRSGPAAIRGTPAGMGCVIRWRAPHPVCIGRC